MEVKNLVNYPVQLGDGKMIGASGTKSDTRKYGKKELTERDQNRVENGKMEVIKQLPEGAEKPSDGVKQKNGGKS